MVALTELNDPKLFNKSRELMWLSPWSIPANRGLEFVSDDWQHL